MKTGSITIAFILVCCMTGLANPKKPSESQVSVLSVKREVFYFKVSKQFLGAMVEVYNKEGAVIHTEKVIRRKTILDFFQLEAGTYIIKIIKGELAEEFECTFNFR